MRYYVGDMPVGNDELYHYGTKGMRWGQRRFQNRDGSLTAAGRLRYGWGRAKSGARRAYGRAVSSSKRYWGSPEKRKQVRQKVARAASIAGSTAAVGALGYAAYKRGFRGFRNFGKTAKKAGSALRSFNIPNRPRLGTGSKTFDAGRLRFTTRAKNAARNEFANVRNTASTIGGKAKNVFRKKRMPYGTIHPGQARLTGGPSFDGSRLKRSTTLKNRANTLRSNVKNRMNTASIERSRRKGMKTGLVVGGPVKGGRKRNATAQRVRDRLGYEKARVETAARNIASKGRGYKKGSSTGRFGGKSSTIRGSRSFKGAQARDNIRNAFYNAPGNAKNAAKNAGTKYNNFMNSKKRHGVGAGVLTRRQAARAAAKGAAVGSIGPVAGYGIQKAYDRYGKNPTLKSDSWRKKHGYKTDVYGNKYRTSSRKRKKSSKKSRK